MTDDDLRRVIRSHAADGELPAGFVESVVDALPDRARLRTTPIAWLGIAAVLVALVVGIAAWSARGPVGGPDPTASSIATATSSAMAELPHAVDENVVLSIEVTPGGAVTGGSQNDVIFRLTDDGRVLYADYVFGERRSDPRVAYLSVEQVEALVAWAIDEGGVAEAAPRYERPSLGPSGMTIITVRSQPLTKQVVYELGPGNLVDDPDPALGRLGELVRRLSHFSDDVTAGNAVGGHTAAEDDVARVLALSDPRLRDVLQARTRVGRIYPDSARVGHLFVEVGLDGDVPWPLAVCDIDRDGPITGAIWLVDVQNRQIAAVSPMWGDVSCLPTASAVGWVEQEWPAYTYVLESTCGERDLLGRFRIQVRGLVVTAVEGLDEQGRLVADRSPLEAFPTMAGLLEIAAEARAAGAESVALTTDPNDGHPVTLEIDWLLAAIDDEECYAVSDLRPDDG